VHARLAPVAVGDVVAAALRAHVAALARAALALGTGGSGSMVRDVSMRKSVPTPNSGTPIFSEDVASAIIEPLRKSVPKPLVPAGYEYCPGVKLVKPWIEYCSMPVS